MKAFWTILVTFLVILGWVITVFISNQALIDAGYAARMADVSHTAIGIVGTFALAVFGVSAALGIGNKEKP